MKKIVFKVGKVTADVAMAITSFSVNSTCPFVTYQPIVPEKANRLKRMNKNEIK